MAAQESSDISVELGMHDAAATGATRKFLGDRRAGEYMGKNS